MNNNEGKYPSQMQDKFNLRFPDGMRDAIAERAKQNGRSMNSEIVQILQNALDPMKDDEHIFEGEWKSIYFDNPDLSLEDDVENKNRKIDEIIAELSGRINNYASRIEFLIKMRRPINKKPN